MPILFCHRKREKIWQEAAPFDEHGPPKALKIRQKKKSARRGSGGDTCRPGRIWVLSLSSLHILKKVQI